VLTVDVSNTGVGIAAEDLPFIFDRFYRGDKARTGGSDSGFGLGLSIAKVIIERLGGAIRATSSEGLTTFSVEIPT
jgi:two-component system sensor histidine kinase ResE